MRISDLATTLLWVLQSVRVNPRPSQTLSLNPEEFVRALRYGSASADVGVTDLSVQAQTIHTCRAAWLPPSTRVVQPQQTRGGAPEVWLRGCGARHGVHVSSSYRSGAPGGLKLKVGLPPSQSSQEEMEAGATWLLSVDSSPLKRWCQGQVHLHVDPQQRMLEGPQLLLALDDSAQTSLPAQLNVRVRSETANHARCDSVVSHEQLNTL
jgi:hypothetical protein